MRYTECRMTPLAMEMVRDIRENTVDFSPNYDGKTQEPVLSTRSTSSTSPELSSMPRPFSMVVWESVPIQVSG